MQLYWVALTCQCTLTGTLLIKTMFQRITFFVLMAPDDDTSAEKKKDPDSEYVATCETAYICLHRSHCTGSLLCL